MARHLHEHAEKDDSTKIMLVRQGNDTSQKITITVNGNDNKTWISEKTDDELRELILELQGQGYSLPRSISSVFCGVEPVEDAELADFFEEMAGIDSTWNSELVQKCFCSESALQIRIPSLRGAVLSPLKPLQIPVPTFYIEEDIQSKEESNSRVPSFMTTKAEPGSPGSESFERKGVLFSLSSNSFAEEPSVCESAYKTCKDWYKRNIQHPAYNLVEHPDFGSFILVFIFVNAIFQALVDPTEDANAVSYQPAADFVFTIVFTVELFLKNLAWGPKKYFRSPWNLLDTVVVIEGIVSLAYENKAGISMLRVLRILRPLRTIQRFSSLRQIVVAILNSSKSLTYISLVFLLFLTMASIFAVVLFQGLMTFRCKDDFNDDYLQLESPDSVGTLCGIKETSQICGGQVLENPYQCDVGQSCIDSKIYPYGIINFDDCLHAMLVLFQVSTLESWNEIMFFTQMVMSKWTLFYFIIVIIIGTYTIINLMISAILSEFQSFANAVNKQSQKSRRKKKKRKVKSTFSSWCKDQIQRQKKYLQDPERCYIKYSSRMAKKHAQLISPKLVSLCEQDSSILNKAVYGMILINVFVLAMDYHGSPGTYADVLEGFNLFFTFAFLAELVFKLVILNPARYLSHWSNICDAAIVAGSMAEVGLTYGTSSGGSSMSQATTFRLVRMFRLFRVLRLSRVSRRWEPMKHAINLLTASLHFMFPAFLLVCLTWFIFAVLGMTLFGSNETHDTADDHYRFDSFFWSLVQVFLVTTGDGWNVIMYQMVAETSIWACFFFIFLIVLGSYLLLNLMLVIILDGAGRELNEKIKRQEIKFKLFSITKKLAERQAFYDWMKKAGIKKKPLLSRGLSTRVHRIFSSKQAEPFASDEADPVEVKMERRMSLKTVAQGFSKIEYWKKQQQETKAKLEMSVVETEKPKGYSQWEILNQPPKKSKLWDWIETNMDKIFGKSGQTKEHRFHDEALILVEDVRFKSFMMAIIFLSTILVVCEQVPAVIALDAVCTFFFILEMIAKIMAYNFWTARNAYIRIRWNQLDVFLIFVGVIGLLLHAGEPNSTSLGIIMVFRSLRPLRLGARMETFKILVATMIQSIEGLTTTASLVVFLWFGYSIVGLQLFQGTFYSCTDPNFPEGSHRDGVQDENGDWLSPPCYGWWVNSTTGIEEYRDFEWANSNHFTFDNIFASMWSLFAVMTVENWQDIMWSTLDATQVDHQPKTNDNKAAFLFFFVAIFLFGFYLTNLFIGVAFETYNTMKATNNGMLVDVEQLRENAYVDHLAHMKMEEVHAAEPEERWRKPIHRLAIRPAFKMAVLFILTINMMFLMSEHKGESRGLANAQQVANDVFAVLFVVEALILIIGLGPKTYFSKNVYRFDFFVTIVSIIDTIISYSWLDRCGDSNITILKLIRAFRVIRLVRLTMSVPGICRVMEITRYPLSHLGNVFCLMAMVGFVFANFGVVVFGHVTFDNDISFRFANFNDRVSAMILLFTVMTGESWPDYEAQIISNGDVPRFVTSLYFFSFILTMQFFLANFFVMIVAEAFEIIGKRHSFQAMIPLYQQMWKEVVDPEGSGKKASEDQLYYFFLNLPPPLGLGNKAPFVAVEWRILRMIQTLDSKEKEWSFNDVIRSMYVLSANNPNGIVPHATMYLTLAKAFLIVQIYRWLTPRVHRWKKRLRSKKVRTFSTATRALIPSKRLRRLSQELSLTDY